MTTQKIRELAEQLQDEVKREKAVFKSTDLNAQKEQFILDEIAKMASEILCLTKEVHEYTYNYYHPDVLKKFPTEEESE